MKWHRFVLGPVGMVLTWAVGWALVGMLIELVLNLTPGPDGYVVDIWPTVMALAGLLAGAVFWTLLRIAGGRRTFDAWPRPSVVAWGAVTGLLLGVLAFATGAASDVLPGSWPRVAAVIVPMTLLGAASALGLIVLAQVGQHVEPARAHPTH